MSGVDRLHDRPEPGRLLLEIPGDVRRRGELFDRETGKHALGLEEIAICEWVLFF